MVPTPYFQKSLLRTEPLSNDRTSPEIRLSSEIGQISGSASDGNQSYNALQAVLQKRLAQGLEFQANYTWSKCMSDSIGYYGAGGAVGSQSAYWQNEYNAASEWGPCFYDVQQHFRGYVTYDLPFGRSRTFGKNMNRFVDACCRRMAGERNSELHGGFPLTIMR